MNRDHQDTVIILDVPGGGSHVVIYFKKLLRVFGEAALSHDFVDIKMGQSVGGIVAASMSVPHDDNPAMSKLPLTGTAQLVSDHIPIWLPNKRWHLAGQVLVKPFMSAVRLTDGLTRTVLGRGLQKVEEVVINTEDQARELWDAYIKAQKALGKDKVQSEALNAIEQIGKDFRFDTEDRKTAREKRKHLRKPWTLHFDRQLNEFVLKYYMGETTMAQATGSTIINAFKIGPNERGDIDMMHIDPKLFEQRPSNDNFTVDARKNLLRLSSEFDDVKLYEAALGASAVPAHFDSYHVKSIDADLVDMAHIQNSSHNLLRLRMALPNTRIIYIKVGTTVNRNPISTLEWGQLSGFGLLTRGHILGPTATKQVIQQHKFAQELFGKENTFFLYEGLDGPLTPPKLDVVITDGRKSQLQKMETFADEIMGIEPDKYQRLHDTLAEVYHGRQVQRGDSAFGIRTPEMA